MSRDSLDEFFAKQQQRIHKALDHRVGEMDDIPDVIDRKALTAECRGNATGHASGRRKPPMDEQGMWGGGCSGKRRQNTWSNLERKHGRLPEYKPEKK